MLNTLGTDNLLRLLVDLVWFVGCWFSSLRIMVRLMLRLEVEEAHTFLLRRVHVCARFSAFFHPILAFPGRSDLIGAAL